MQLQKQMLLIKMQLHQLQMLLRRCYLENVTYQMQDPFSFRSNATAETW